jgi:hypothetical protein
MIICKYLKPHAGIMFGGGGRENGGGMGRYGSTQAGGGVSGGMGGMGTTPEAVATASDPSVSQGIAMGAPTGGMVAQSSISDPRGPMAGRGNNNGRGSDRWNERHSDKMDYRKNMMAQRGGMREDMISQRGGMAANREDIRSMRGPQSSPEDFKAMFGSRNSNAGGGK